MSEYEVTREDTGYRIREPGQKGPGMLVTFGWLRSMGFGSLTRSNIDHVVRATMASAGGVVLNPSRKPPSDIAFTPGFKSYPARGR